MSTVSHGLRPSAPDERQPRSGSDEEVSLADHAATPRAGQFPQRGVQCCLSARNHADLRMSIHCAALDAVMSDKVMVLTSSVYGGLITCHRNG